MSDSFAAPYDGLADNLKATILRTWRNKTPNNANFGWQLGFLGVKNEMSLMDLLQKMDKAGHLQVVKEVHARCARVAGLWERIHEITGIWNLAAGDMVSSGFNYTCIDADGMLAFMRDSGKGGRNFCEDDPSTTVHGPRDCFREMITAGPGLHVCITHKDKRAGNNPHDIHIDVWQVVCKRKENGQCDYSYWNGQFWNHIKEAGPWAVKKKAAETLKAMGEAQKNLPPDFYRGPKY